MDGGGICLLLYLEVMIDKAKIVEIVNELLSDDNTMFLVDVTVSDDNDIEIEVDSYERMFLDQCSELSRNIEARLDRNKEDFSLTVMSAGVGYPFKVFNQYLKAIGKDVEVDTPDGKKICGILSDAREENGNIIITIVYNVLEKVEGKKRPCQVEHIDSITVDNGVIVKELITIK